MKLPVLIIHGGAGRHPGGERLALLKAHLARIARQVHPQLSAGMGAVEAVVEANRLLEDCPEFNAGTGSKLQCDGAARLSASLMDGPNERFAGVVNIEGTKNPILLAKALLGERDRTLCGEGARARALELGLEQADVRTPGSIARWEEGKTGTVGAVAVDLQGRIAAGTSTGGRGMERVGRVSDSCTVAGNFATAAAGVSCTGIGEDIVDGALAVRLVTAVDAGLSLEEAAAQLVTRMRGRGWKAGLIALDAHGLWAAIHTTETMYWHVVEPGGEVDGPEIN
jgi:L-asparaginase